MRAGNAICFLRFSGTHPCPRDLAPPIGPALRLPERFATLAALEDERRRIFKPPLPQTPLESFIGEPGISREAFRDRPYEIIHPFQILPKRNPGLGASANAALFLPRSGIIIRASPARPRHRSMSSRSA